MRQAVKTAPRRIADRTLRINVSPDPTTLQHRRGILRVLKSFGDVVTFKWLGKEPKPARNVILMVFQRAESARQLLDEAPLRFKVETPGPPPPNSSLATLEMLDNQPKADTDSPNDKGQEDQEYQDRTVEFFLRADASTHDMPGRVQRHPFHGPFTINTRSYAQEDLAHNVPVEGFSILLSNPRQLEARFPRRYMEEAANREKISEMYARRKKNAEVRSSLNETTLSGAENPNEKRSLEDVEDEGFRSGS